MGIFCRYIIKRVNMHAQLSSGNRCLYFSLSLQQCRYFVYAGSKCYHETAHLGKFD